MIEFAIAIKLNLYSSRMSKDLLGRLLDYVAGVLGHFRETKNL